MLHATKNVSNRNSTIHFDIPDNIRDVRNNNNNNNNNHPRKEHHHIKENHRSNGSNVNKAVESRHRSNRTHQFKDFLQQGPRSPN